MRSSKKLRLQQTLEAAVHDPTVTPPRPTGWEPLPYIKRDQYDSTAFRWGCYEYVHPNLDRLCSKRRSRKVSTHQLTLHCVKSRAALIRKDTRTYKENSLTSISS